MEGGDEAQHEVLLHLYDLSNGMARTMSAALLGKQIEGIWHTGVVVHGIEWYFGGGVQRSAPGRTPYGAPVRVIPLGRTAIDAAVVEDFMRDMSGKYTAETCVRAHSRAPRAQIRLARQARALTARPARAHVVAATLCCATTATTTVTRSQASSSVKAFRNSSPACPRTCFRRQWGRCSPP